MATATHTASSSNAAGASGLFRDIAFIVSSLGLTSLKIGFLRQLIIAQSGTIYTVKNDLLKAIESHSEVYIVCGEKVSSSELAGWMKKTSLLPEALERVKGIHANWISTCLQTKTLLPLQDFLIDPQEALRMSEMITTTTVTTANIFKRPFGSVVETCTTEVLEKKVKYDLPAREVAPKLHPIDGFSPIPTSKSPLWQEVLAPDGSVAVLVRYPLQAPASSKIAAFDADGTLISTKSGKRFAVNSHDWRWWHPSVPAKLRELVSRGYRIVIFSNQKGISSGTVNSIELKQKFLAITEKLGIPATVYLSAADDIFRKPRTGTWTLLADYHNEGVKVDYHESFFVGDAAGRPKEASHSKDFSTGDLKYALNLNILFKTPEEFFIGSKMRLHVDRSVASLGFNPTDLLQQETAPGQDIKEASTQEIVLLVGCPASGKSTFCRRFFPSYFRINQDTLKTMPKCIKACEGALDGGKSVVIDNTNKEIRTRAIWIAIAEKRNLPIRAIFLDVSKEMSIHLNAFRYLNPKSTDRRSVPIFAIHKAFKDLQVPQLNEGFNEVMTASFVLDSTLSTAEKDLLSSYLIP